MRPPVVALVIILVLIALAGGGWAKGGGRGGGGGSRGGGFKGGSSSKGSSGSRPPSSGSSYPKQPSSGSSYPKQPLSGSSYPKQPGSYGWGSAYGGNPAKAKSGVLGGGALSSKSYSSSSSYKGASIKGNLVRAAQVGIAYKAFKMSRPGYRRVNLFYVPYPRYYYPYYYPGVYYSGVHYHRPIYYGLKCYHCDSNVDDNCAVDGGTNKVVTCSPYQYCSVMRRETNITNPVPKTICINETLNATTADGEPQNVTICTNSSQTTTRVKISRGCMSYNLENYLKAERQEGVSTSFQTCTTTNCNSGNGRLKCYTCQGNGTDNCVSEPEKVANETFCRPYENCHVLRREVKTGNATEVYVKRGCKAYDYLPEDSNGDDDNERLYAQSCSMDLCNVGLRTTANLTIDDPESANLTSKANSTESGLQCYLCEGSDYDSCVLGKDDQRLTCQEDEECNVMRKHTPVKESGELLVEVWRGCKPINYTFENPEDPKVSMFSQSCSFNFCNTGLNSGVAMPSVSCVYLLMAIAAVFTNKCAQL